MAKGKPQIKSIRALAKAVGRSHEAVARWVRREDWPFGTGPWAISRVGGIKAWAEKTLAENPAAGAPAAVDGAKSLNELPLSKRIDAGLKLSRKAKIDYELAVKKGEYHSTEECRQRRLRQIHEVKTALLNMPDGLPLDADAKTMIKGRVLEILRNWSTSPDPANAAPDSHGPGPGSSIAR